MANQDYLIAIALIEQNNERAMPLGGKEIKENLEGDNFIKLGEEVTFGNNMVSVMAKDMSELMINEGFTNIDEVWGTEIGLIAPGLYAGTTDCVGMHNGEEAIIDFKTSKKIKKEEWIEDYYLQCCAYALAHNEMFDTDIKKVAILMVDRDSNFKDFVIEGKEFEEYCDKWSDRLADYYSKIS